MKTQQTREEFIKELRADAKQFSDEQLALAGIRIAREKLKNPGHEGLAIGMQVLVDEMKFRMAGGAN